MWIAFLCSLPAALGASLDNIEIGGPWGTPTATDGTAAWWNPAGLAAARGTRFMVEGAPTVAGITYERTEPHAGTDAFELRGVVPFAGVASDLGGKVPGLGAGAVFAVPYVRGGSSTEEDGAARYHMREGQIQGMVAMGGLAWQYRDLVSVGAAAGVLLSTWTATVDTETMVDLDRTLEEEGTESGYTDADLEGTDYATLLEFGRLSDQAFVWSVGARLALGERATLGAAWISGASVANQGDLTLDFGCPPQEDTLGRFGAEKLGLCDTELSADATVAYRLPWRLHGGLRLRPTDRVTTEPMAGYVAWSGYSDFDITIGGVAERNPDATEEAVDLVEQHRLWARENTDSVWVGFDAKAQLSDQFLLGGRVLYDQAAVLHYAVSGNNYDANDTILSVLAAYRPVRGFELGLSWSHHLLATREITTSAFHMSLDETVEDRWNYPHANGTYAGTINRFGVQVRGSFGG